MKNNKIIITGILVLVILIMSLFLVSAANTNSTKLKCQRLFWFDDINKDCNSKKFCGLYMYPGLRTFQSFNDCKKSLVENSTGNESYKICNWKSSAIKDSCFDYSKDNFKKCVQNSTNKDEKKLCINEYNKNLKTCMSNFKIMKSNCELLKCKNHEILVNGTCIPVDCGRDNSSNRC